MCCCVLCVFAQQRDSNNNNNNKSKPKNVAQKERPPVPSACPPFLAALMQRCWADDAARRPSFAELLPELDAELARVAAASDGDGGGG